MNILITGANGFVGKHLKQAIKVKKDICIFEFDVSSTMEELEAYCTNCDFCFHLAGVNRPKDSGEFITGNIIFTLKLLNMLKKCGNLCPIVFSSSIQAVLDNPYGFSKRSCEEILFEYSRETGTDVMIYRFPNIFGKWSRPDYNSAIATFCYNLTHGLPIQVNDRQAVLNLVYIEDLIAELLQALNKIGHIGKDGYYYIPEVYQVTLGHIVDLLYSFEKSDHQEFSSDNTFANSPCFTISDKKLYNSNYLQNDSTKAEFIKKLFITYISYKEYIL